MNQLRHGGLFEGYGGTTLAAEMILGPLDTRWVSDIKPAAVRLLEQHRPGVPNLGDMRLIHGGRVAPVDVLTFSWPCQPHSVAGRRRGADDPRALWPYVAQVIRRARPAILLGENVARIITSGELARVVADLEAMGYRVTWRAQRADQLGLCHRRARCFLVAVDPDQVDVLASARAGLADAWPMPIDPEVSPLLKTPTAQLATNGGSQHPDKRKAGGHGPTLADEVEWLLPTPTARSWKAPDPRGPRPEAKSPGMNLETAVTLLPAPREGDGTKGGPNQAFGGYGRGATPGLAGAVQSERFGRYALAVARHAVLIGRPAPEPTMAGRSGNRVLSPYFVEWMMALPEGHVCGIADLAQSRPSGWRSRALSLLGDGVVPLQGAAAYGPLLRAALDDALHLVA